MSTNLEYRERETQRKRERRRRASEANVQPGSFWKFLIVVVQNNGKEMFKKVCCTSKVAFWLIRPIVVFFVSFAA